MNDCAKSRKVAREVKSNNTLEHNNEDKNQHLKFKKRRMMKIRGIIDTEVPMMHDDDDK